MTILLFFLFLNIILQQNVFDKSIFEIIFSSISKLFYRYVNQYEKGKLEGTYSLVINQVRVFYIFGGKDHLTWRAHYLF